jgi:hypothetical protein
MRVHAIIRTSVRDISGEKNSTQQRRAAVEQLFAYYLTATDRHPKMYELTPARMQKGLARLEDCRRKCSGDLVKAEQLMGMAIAGCELAGFESDSESSPQQP